MAINNSQVCVAGTELAAVMTGSVVFIGSLPVSPVILIFDNQGTSSVAISVNDSTGATVWRTFVAAEALILDLRAGSGIAPNFTFPVGTNFYGNGASGTFSISYVYAQNM
jgi:hypothetical protein